MVIPSLMIAMSGIMKLVGSEQVIEGLTKAGLGSYIYPKTYKVGFLLLCSYLGGAMSIELAGGQLPMAGVFIAAIWTSVFLKNREMFL